MRNIRKKLVRKHVWIRDWQSHTSWLVISFRRVRSAQTINCGVGLLVKRSAMWWKKCHYFLTSFWNHFKSQQIFSQRALKCYSGLHCLWTSPIRNASPNSWVLPIPRSLLFPSLFTEEKKKVLSLKYITLRKRSKT